MAHLLGGRINIGLLREAARAELKDILGSSHSKKVNSLCSLEKSFPAFIYISICIPLSVYTVYIYIIYYASESQNHPKAIKNRYFNAIHCI